MNAELDRSRDVGVLGRLEVPLALGMLRLCTDGRPDDIDAEAVIHFALGQGIRVLDTADSYSLSDDDFHYGEHLARRAVAAWNGPKEDVRIITKVGLTRPGGRWMPCGRPEHLRSSATASLEALGVDQLFLLLLHARDPHVPFEESLAAIAEIQRDGIAAHVGLCNVTTDEVRQAQRHFEVVCVQNELSVLNRKSATDGLLDFTKDAGIPFLAHRPLGGYAKTAKLKQDPILSPLAQRHGVTTHDVALAALLASGDHVLPIIGATRMRSVKSSVQAVGISLDVSDRTALAIRYSFATNQQPGAQQSFAFASNDPTAMFGATPTVSGVPSAPSVDGTGALQPSQVGMVSDFNPTSLPQVVVLMGIQGAGKSELVSQYVSHGYARLNRDELGGTLDDLVPRLQQLLGSGQQRVVLDNTYPTRVSRAPVLAAARMFGVPVVCRHLLISMSDARINVAKRMVAKYGVPLGPDEMKQFRKMDPTLPPPQALDRWMSSFEPPALDEGFVGIQVIPFIRQHDPEYTGLGLLLDVDGTLRQTISGEFYPRHPDDVVLLPGRREVLQRWIDAGYQLFFVSNQSGIAWGRVSHQAVQAAMLRTAELLGLPVSEVSYCPHTSRPVGCFCRKPMPGLGVYLIERHRLDHSRLIMVGDMDSDADFAAGLQVPFIHADTFFNPDSPSLAP